MRRLQRAAAAAVHLRRGLCGRLTARRCSPLPACRLRHLSRVSPQQGPDAGQLAALFDRFLELRAVFCINRFLSGWCAAADTFAAAVLSPLHAACTRSPYCLHAACMRSLAARCQGPAPAAARAQRAPTNRQPPLPPASQVSGRAAGAGAAGQPGGLSGLWLPRQGALPLVWSAGCALFSAQLAAALRPALPRLQPHTPAALVPCPRPHAAAAFPPAAGPHAQAWDQLSPAEQAEASAFVDRVESAWGVRFEPGHTPGLPFMAHAWEPLRCGGVVGGAPRAGWQGSRWRLRVPLRPCGLTLRRLPPPAAATWQGVAQAPGALPGD